MMEFEAWKQNPKSSASFDERVKAWNDIIDTVSLFSKQCCIQISWVVNDPAAQIAINYALLRHDGYVCLPLLKSYKQIKSADSFWARSPLFLVPKGKTVEQAQATPATRVCKHSDPKLFETTELFKTAKQAAAVLNHLHIEWFCERPDAPSPASAPFTQGILDNYTCFFYHESRVKNGKMARNVQYYIRIFPKTMDLDMVQEYQKILDNLYG
jgi:hypothetical protein